MKSVAKEGMIFNAFRRPYVWLLIFSLSVALILTISAITSTFSIPSRIQQVLTILSVGVFSSYLTAVLIDGTFRNKEKRERKRLQNIALAEFSKPLTSYIILIKTWYRSSINEKPEDPPDTLKELIVSEEMEKIRLLNFAETYPIYDGPPDYTYLNKSAKTIKMFQDNIDEIIQKYSHVMEPELVDSLQNIRNSRLFSNIIFYEDYVEQEETQLCPLFAADLYIGVQENLSELVKIIEYYEEPNAPEITVLDLPDMWTDDLRPGIGDARMEIPFECIKQIELTDEPPFQVLEENVWETIEECRNEAE